MLRIRSNFLTMEDNKLSFEGSLFSGLSYDVGHEGLVEGVSIVEEGVRIGMSDDLVALPENGLRVDEEYLEELEDYGPATYQGVGFVGVGYLFSSDGQCESEAIYENGFAGIKHTRTWYLTGEPESVLINGVRTSWSIEGSLMMKSTPKGTVFNLRFSDEDHIIGIIVKENDLVDFAVLSRFGLGEELTLVGSTVDTRFLRELHRQLDLTGLRALKFSETSIDASFIEVVLLLEDLVKLALDDNGIISRADALRFKQQRPKCTILFNDARVDLEPDNPDFEA